MQFHNYLPECKELILQCKGLKAAEMCKVFRESGRSDAQSCCGFAEMSWMCCERPYYNVYPSILDMLLDVSLDVPADAIRFPYSAILIRLPHGVTRVGWRAVLVFSDDSKRFTGGLGDFSGVMVLNAQGVLNGQPVALSIGRKNYAQDTVESFCEKIEPNEIRGGYLPPNDDSVRKAMGDAVRIAVGVAIIAADPNFVQPIVLNRDKLKYANSDEATKKYLEDRATRFNGRGFNVGEKLEQELAADSHNVSAHIRRPHMALFWTGKGREMPRLQLRRGCLVKPHDITKVPTGFLDREQPEVCK